MEALLVRQQEIVEGIQKIDVNFGKDSPSRKTRKYLDDRLDSLDRLWAEFQSNNDKLLAYEHEEGPYFDEDQFQKARTYFNSIRLKIASFKPLPENPRPSSPNPLLKQVPPPPAGPTTDPLNVRTSIPYNLPKLTLPTTSSGLSTTTSQATEMLSQQRTNFRAFYRQINRIKVDEICDKWELEDELRNLQSRWNTIDNLHLQIDNILQGSDQSYEEEFCTYETYFISMKKTLNLKLASAAHLQHTTPQIDIPIFHGKYTQWPTFYDMYTEAIHNNNLLTKSQKMQHLKGKLRGEAEKLIQHLHISADNYDTAWKLLEHRFSNNQILFTRQIEIFLNQPNANKQTSFDIKRIYDTSMESIYAIKNMGIDITSWDPILVHHITKKLDQETYSEYKEARKSPRELPSLAELMEFLEAKFTALEPINTKERSTTPTYKQYSPQPPQQKMYKKPFPAQQSSGFHQKKQFQAVATYTGRCLYCNMNNHLLSVCRKFSKLDIDEKMIQITKYNVCHNCLTPHTSDIPCDSSKKCKHCQKSHHSMLHDAYVDAIDTRKVHEPASGSKYLTTAECASSSNQLKKQHVVNHVAADDEEILLTTISLKVKGIDGTFVTLRALLDQGSQITLVSENAAQMLGLPRQNYHASVSGIGNGPKQGKGIISLNCQSIYDDYDFTTQALVIRNVINHLPNVTFNKQTWPHLQHINLADPEYNVSRPVDLLLDASVYSDIIMSGLIKGPNKAPIAQQTKLGWILSGNVKTFNCHVVINNLSEISQYWELEEIKETTPGLTPDEQYCEEFYQSTTKRLDTGRYEVAIPMKPGFQKELGQSKSKAIAQFYNLEKKFKRNESLSESYKQFIKDYEEQGHMFKASGSPDVLSCYLPHHGVMKLESTTTKLRTVFNASSKTSTGNSLNDLMECGPNLQKDLPHLILVWRQYKYVLTADIDVQSILYINVLFNLDLYIAK